MPSTLAAGSRPVRHIDIYSPEDRAYWCERLGITDDALRQTVKLIGSRASTVAAHLGVAL
ncbi:DUF3606 domain-containing protein [uncultured Methylobacterium sp.]|jgi:hypothetical protein|uniref:DUF3606 domain-containing protein n=1 Tax=uncultured Methylobacterium sp. TaxID=157278 RepID=UPI0026347153|nr:DUF3606 domain-containing protein [uncultured Methylobacterium sp.]